MEREILKFDSEQGQAIVDGDTDEFETVSDEIIDHTRWSVVHEIIVKRKSDGLFFVSSYSVGATESQDEAPYEYSDAVFKQVVPLEKTITYYGWDSTR